MLGMVCTDVWARLGSNSSDFNDDFPLRLRLWNRCSLAPKLLARGPLHPVVGFSARPQFVVNKQRSRIYFDNDDRVFTPITAIAYFLTLTLITNSNRYRESCCLFTFAAR